MEEISFDGEFLKDMKLEFEKTLNALIMYAVKLNKEAELSLKINVSVMDASHTNKETGEFIEEIRPHLSYRIIDKVKEMKGKKEGHCNDDFVLMVNKDTGKLYVKKINEQIKM